MALGACVTSWPSWDLNRGWGWAKDKADAAWALPDLERPAARAGGASPPPQGPGARLPVVVAEALARVEAWEVIPGAPVSQAGSIQHGRPLHEGRARRGQALRFARGGASLGPKHILLLGERRAARDLCDKAGGLAGAMCTPGESSL